MSAIDDCVNKEYTFIENEDFSEYEYHQRCWDTMKDELKNYAREQVKLGAKLCISHPSANCINLMYKTKGKDGETYYIMQALQNDPRNNTYIGCEIKDNTLFVARYRQCAGLDVTDTHGILNRAFVCGKCGEPVSSMRELNYVLYAGAECDKCSGKSWDYINSKPSGYWTS